MTYLHLLTFSKLSDMYTWLQSCSAQDELIESGSLHRGHFLVLLKSPQKKERPRLAADFFVTSTAIESLFSAYHKQITLPLRTSLLVLESDLLSEILGFLAQHTELLPSLLEIQRQALPQGKATAILLNLTDFDTSKLPPAISAAWIPSPNSLLQQLF